MIDFQRFETFDPSGPGLGNLFGQVSPFEALGIWPSGDFRLAPGDGAVPAIGYYLGIAFALALLIYGIVRCWRGRETAILAGLGAAAIVYVAARAGGTPYTAAKAIEVAAPLAALTILVPLLADIDWRLSRNMSDQRATWRFPLGMREQGATALPPRLRPRRRHLLAARARQRSRRPNLLLAGAHRDAPADRRRLDPRSRSRRAACRRTRHALPRLGAARRPGLHQGRVRSRRARRHPASGSSSPKASAPNRRTRASASAASLRHTSSGKRPGPSPPKAPAR